VRCQIACCCLRVLSSDVSVRCIRLSCCFYVKSEILAVALVARAAHVEERLSVSQHRAEAPETAAAAETGKAAALGVEESTSAAQGPSATPSLSSMPPDVLQQFDAEAGEGQRRPFEPQQDDAGVTHIGLCCSIRVRGFCAIIAMPPDASGDHNLR